MKDVKILFLEQNGVRQAVYLRPRPRRNIKSLPHDLHSPDDDRVFSDEIPAEEWLTVWEAQPSVLHRFRLA